MSLAPHPNRDDWRAYLTGALSAEQQELYSAHLETCQTCQTELAALTPLYDAPPSAPAPTNPTVLRPPDVPGYEVAERPLGRGGMGVVWRALDTRLNRLVALKVLRVDALEPITETELARFRSEAHTLAQLQHPNIVQVFDYNVVGGQPYLALELLTGGDLDRLCRQQPQAQDVAAERLETLAHAIAYAHERRVIHRDLKPHNILIAAQGTLKLADFGLARTTSGHHPTQTNAQAGTPAYMAPEQIQAQPLVAPSVDIWALGVILYEQLTGRLPFLAADTLATFDLIRAANPIAPRRLLPSISRDLEIICLKCLQLEPHRRYRSAHELADDLGRFRRQEPIRARAIGWPERVWRGARRRPVLAGLAGLVLVLLGVAIYLGVGKVNADYAQYQAESRRLLSEAQAAATLAEERRTTALREQVQAARTAAVRGDWRTAIANYDRALADDYPDALTLRVERLPAYFALNLPERIAAELQELTALSEAELGRHAAKVYLLAGDRELSDWWLRAQGQRWIKKAVARLPDLAPADQAYALALAAPRVFTTLAWLQTALEIDPFHHRALGALSVLRIIRGELAEAQRLGARMAELFPDDLLVPMIPILIGLVDGDRATMNGGLARLGTRLGPERATEMQQIRKFCLEVDQYIQSTNQLIWSGPQVNFLHLMWASVRGMQLLKAPRVAGPLAVGVPTTGRLFELFEALPAVAQNLANPKFLPRIRELRRDFPDVVFLTIEMTCWGGEFSAKQPPDEARVRQVAAEISQLGPLVDEAPTLWPRSQQRLRCRLFATAMALGWVQLEPNVSPAKLDWLRQQLDRVPDDLRSLPASERKVWHQILCEFWTTGLTRTQRDYWPDVRERQARKDWIAAVGQRYYLAWELLHPQESTAAARTALEVWRGTDD
jgi:tetratricopeptide (TPR) repeat protein